MLHALSKFGGGADPMLQAATKIRHAKALNILLICLITIFWFFYGLAEITVSVKAESDHECEDERKCEH